MTTTTVLPASHLASPKTTHSLLRGLNPGVLRIELARTLRNRRAMMFSVLMPAFFYLIFGGLQSIGDEPAGRGNVRAAIMVAMALYGSCVAASSAGAAVSTERTSGWTRQLRITPLTSAAWIMVKLLMGLVASALAVTVVFACGAFTHAHMPAGVWVESFVVTWLCSPVFAALGLAVAYIVPPENAQQILGFGMTVLAFLGGLFIPISDGSLMGRISQFTPMWGIRVLAQTPLDTAGFRWVALVNAVGWLAIFAALAAWRMSKDTARG